MDDNIVRLLKDLFENNDSKVSSGLMNLHLLIQNHNQSLKLETFNLIGLDFLEEIKRIENSGESSIYFGKTLRDIKCIIQDDEYVRRHEIFIRYKEPKKLCISNANLPYTNIQDNEYCSIHDIIIAYKKYTNDLSRYLYELELIDQQCEVMEPINPTFKDDYRRILIDSRTLLHIEVTQEGLATNIHLMGQSQIWQDKLQKGLLSWDHDKNIITNILTVFDLMEFPQNSRQLTFPVTGAVTLEPQVCSICLCTQLPDISHIPLPLCQNISCGMYFHRYCLFEWLIASASHPPVFGVTTGSCPSCLQPIVCNELDS